MKKGHSDHHKKMMHHKKEHHKALAEAKHHAVEMHKAAKSIAKAGYHEKSMKGKK